MSSIQGSGEKRSKVYIWILCTSTVVANAVVRQEHLLHNRVCLLLGRCGG
jgi:hypothetical protein